MQILKRILFGVMACCLLATGAAPSAQAGLQLDENKIKAGLLYNFIKYTEWPANAPLAAESGLKICLYGGDSFAGALSPLAGRTAQQHRIAIAQVSRVDQLSSCSAVVIHGSASGAVAAVTAYARANNILTFSDISGFASRGGMVEFARKDERVQVLVNSGAARAAALQISARLLKVATVVGPE